jgi:hypothetical protein
MASEIFQFANAINNGKPIEVDDSYNTFLTGRLFSNHLDTVLIANEVNKFPSIEPEQHYEFLANMVRPRKRFGKWHKPLNHKSVGIISRYYDVPMRLAYMYVQFFTEDEIRTIEEQLSGE